LSQIIG